MDITITRTAHELTLMFADDLDIPTKYKKVSKGKKLKKAKKETLKEGRFNEHVIAWSKTVQSILDNSVDKNQAWRFIRMEPLIEPSVTSLTSCKNFIDFTNFLSQRRDEDICEGCELGKLCLLHYTFQKKIEISFIK